MHTFNSTKGSILLVVLMIYSLFGLTLFLNANMILLDQMATEYTAKAMEVFYIAEAGLAYGIAYARDRKDELPSLLPGNDGIGGGAHHQDDGLLYFGADVPYHKGRFTVRIHDNDEHDKDPYTDTDAAYILSSTAYIDPNIQKTLYVVLHCPDSCYASAWVEKD